MSDAGEIKLLHSEIVPPTHFMLKMNGYGGVFMQDRSNRLRHVYYSRRLNRWFAVSSERGGVRVNHYTHCPCALST